MFSFTQGLSSSLLDNCFDLDISLLWLMQKISAKFCFCFQSGYEMPVIERISESVKSPSFLTLTNKQKLLENKKENEKLILD